MDYTTHQDSFLGEIFTNIMYPPNRVDFFPTLYTRVRLKEWVNSWDMHHEAEGALILGIPNPTPPLRPLSEVFNQSNALVELFKKKFPMTPRGYHTVSQRRKGKNRNAHGSRLSNFQNAPPCAERKVLCPHTLEIFLPVLYLWYQHQGHHVCQL